MLHRICTYGLFRKNQINYNWIRDLYGHDSFLYIRTLIIPGYKMYDTIYSPSVVITGKLEDKIVVDVIMAEQDAYNRLRKIQDDQEFFEDLICIEDKFYSIFLCNNDSRNNKEVIDGDWVKYYKC